MTERRRPNNRRISVTHKIEVGNRSIFINIGFESGELDAPIVEVFLDTAREGTEMRSLMNGFAMIISLALQHGTPLEEIIDALKDFGDNEFPKMVVDVLQSEEQARQRRILRSLNDSLGRRMAAFQTGTKDWENMVILHAETERHKSDVHLRVIGPENQAYVTHIFGSKAWLHNDKAFITAGVGTVMQLLEKEYPQDIPAYDEGFIRLEIERAILAQMSADSVEKDKELEPNVDLS